MTHEMPAITFTDEEIEALLKVRETKPSFYLPEGKTIRDQKRSRPMYVDLSGYEEKDGLNRLLDRPARRIEVAIWADPEKPEDFFVPGTFNKNTGQQDKLMNKEAEALRKRPGLSGVTIISPEASEVTEVMFKHFDTTGVRLLGEKWDKDGYGRYIRTNTSTNKEGSDLADVGNFFAGSGPFVFDLDRDEGHVDLGRARWVVPNRFKTQPRDSETSSE